MQDLKFNIVTRELEMKDNDFVLTANPSVQNGGILCYSRGANPLRPTFGIGLIPEVIDGNPKVLTYELNRWKFQAIQDGATYASWKADPSARNSEVITQISYL